MRHFSDGVAAGLAGADSFRMGLKVVVVYLPLYRWIHYVIAGLEIIRQPLSFTMVYFSS